jgi:hypothetical protein
VARSAYIEFIVLGATSVLLNTIADLVVVYMAAPWMEWRKNYKSFRDE